MANGGLNGGTNKPRSDGHSRPEDGKPTPGPGDIYEIEDDTDAIIITGAPGPGRAKEAGAKASPTGGRDDSVY